MNKSVRGGLLLAVTACIWGTAFVAQSMGMDRLGPFSFNGIRTLLGAAALLPVIFLMGRTSRQKAAQEKAPPNRNYLGGGVLCGVILFAASSLQQIGIQYTTAGKAGFLTALYIVIVPILGIFFKRVAGLMVWVSVIIAAFGTYLLSVKEGFRIELGDLYVIFGALIFSFHIMVIDHYAPKTDGVKMAFVQFLVSGGISLVVALLLESPQMADILASWGPLLYTGLISCGLAYTLQILGQRDTPPALASLIMSLESVFAVLAGWLILGEQLAPREILGCTLVFAAVVLAQVPSFRRRKLTT